MDSPMGPLIVMLLGVNTFTFKTLFRISLSPYFLTVFEILPIFGENIHSMVFLNWNVIMCNTRKISDEITS